MFKNKLILLFVFQILSKTLYPNYVEPREVKKYFPTLKVTNATPAFSHGNIRVTSNNEMQQYINALDQKSSKISVQTLGQTSRGKNIPYVILTENGTVDKNKVTVWIHAMKHGDEPASGEAALGLINYLSKEGAGYLRSCNVIIVPRVNMDGADNSQRFSSSGIDICLDHSKLELSETRAIANGIRKYPPDVVIDLHEYAASTKVYKDLENGILPYYDVEFEAATNSNIAKYLRNITTKGFIEPTRKELAKNGVTSSYYYNNIYQTQNLGDKRIRLVGASSEINIGRNFYGVYPGISMLVELRGKDIGIENYERRVESGVMVLKNMIKICSEKQMEIKNAINQSRHSTGQLTEEITVLSGNDVTREIYKFIELGTGQLKDIEVEVKRSGQSPLIKRTKPWGYVLDSTETQAVEILKKQGIKVDKVDKDMSILVDEYQIKEIQKDNKMYEGVYRTYIKTDLIRKKVDIKAGSYLISTNQPEGDLIVLLLEPEGLSSLVRHSIVDIKNKKVPIYRVMEKNK
ncbi:MAG: M14 family zinc carboxypeptidase [Cetobacterium sp.]|uniref:M14 family zinc carboxypeptidase n=1 Tax=Cetobacterium sp. TaxID=2071632 RepID=UPI002FC85864